MDAVQRAYESQIRRDVRKRQQLQNQLILEEQKLVRQKQKNDTERYKEVLQANQALERMQMEVEKKRHREARMESVNRSQAAHRSMEKFRHYEKELSSNEHAQLMAVTRRAAEQLAKQKAEAKDEHIHEVVERGHLIEEERRQQALMKEQQFQEQVKHMESTKQRMSTVLRQQSEAKENHRRRTIRKAEEIESGRVSAVQDKIVEQEDKFNFMQVKKAEQLEHMRRAASLREDERRQQVHMADMRHQQYRQQVLEKHQDKRERVEALEVQKAALLQEMSRQRASLGNDEAKLNTAVNTLRLHRSYDALDNDGLGRALSEVNRKLAESARPGSVEPGMGRWADSVAAPVLARSAAAAPAPAARARPKSAMRARPKPSGPAPAPRSKPPPRPVSAPRSRAASGGGSMHRTTGQSMQSLYSSASPRHASGVSPKRPTHSSIPSKYSSSPIGAKVSPAEYYDSRQSELEELLALEQKRERERDGILRQVRDPRQANRLNKLFTLERQQAKQTILRLQSMIS